MPRHVRSEKKWSTLLAYQPGAKASDLRRDIYCIGKESNNIEDVQSGLKR
jgi:hypothetical protein